jgi:hypothetical protein
LKFAKPTKILVREGLAIRQQVKEVAAVGVEVEAAAAEEMLELLKGLHSTPVSWHVVRGGLAAGHFLLCKGANKFATLHVLLFKNAVHSFTAGRGSTAILCALVGQASTMLLLSLSSSTAVSPLAFVFAVVLYKVSQVM